MLKRTVFSLSGLLISLLVLATVVEAFLGTDFVKKYFYTSPFTICLWILTVILSVVYLFRQGVYKNLITFLLHFSFVVILAGSLVTHLFGKQGTAHLRIEQPQNEYVVDDGRSCFFEFSKNAKNQYIKLLLLLNYLKDLKKRDVLIAGICAGVDVLDNAGILHDVKSTHSTNQDLVNDKNVITARANAYVDFAIEVAKKLDELFDRPDLLDDIDIMLVEQPALHLHPAAHASVAYQLADMAKKLNRKCIIETHSENILLAIRNLVADKSSNLNSDDVIIYFIDSDEEQEAFVQEITIDEMGQLSTWPEGVFSEGFDLLAQIMQHREI